MIEGINSLFPAGTLEQQIHKLLQAVEQSPSTVMITDTNGNIDYINPKFFSLTGYQPAEVIGKNVRLLKLGDQPPEVYKALWDNLRAGKEWRGRFHNLRKDGTVYWENVSIAPLRNDAGQTTHYIKVAEDITKVVELEKLKDDLTRMIVHDLKNPLTGIMSTAELFATNMLGPLTAEQRKFIDNIALSGRKMLNLIMDMLMIGMMEESKLNLNKTRFTPAKLFKGLAWLEIEAQKEEKTLEMTSDKELIITADQSLITRVLENLVNNAFKHTSRGGRVALRVTRYALRNEVLFEVVDNGEGIPAEYLARVFDKFFKVESQTLKSKIDTGLGLTFCKLVIEAHGGRIWVESEIGKGSKFFFLLPLK